MIRTFLETCHRRDGADRDWARSLGTELKRLSLLDIIGIVAYAYELESGRWVAVPWLYVDDRTLPAPYDPGGAGLFMQAINRETWGASLVRHVFAKPFPGVATLSEMEEEVQISARRWLPREGNDTAGLIGRLCPTRGFVLGWLSGHDLSLDPSQHRHLDALSGHVAVGFALRSMITPEELTLERRVASVLSPTGRLLYADPAVSALPIRTRLADAVRQMDQARCSHRHTSPEEALALWQATIEGHYALLEAFERDGKRVILAVRVYPGPYALTPREALVVQHVARGYTNKKIGDLMGIATSTVATHLTSALKKLGYKRRTDLILKGNSLSGGQEQ